MGLVDVTFLIQQSNLPIVIHKCLQGCLYNLHAFVFPSQDHSDSRVYISAVMCPLTARLGAWGNI